MADKWHTNDNDFNNDLVHISVNGELYDMADTYARAQLLKKIDAPETEGTNGQILTYTENGPVWGDAPENSTATEVIEYTAWEVYPTDHLIEAGSTEIGEKVWGDDTLKATYAIPASMTEEFSLWITKSRLETDIIIDWGDGVVEKLAELTPTAGADKDGQADISVYVAHTYEAPNQVYTIKVYGKDYCRISRNSTKLSGDNRLICKCFTKDLPIASHLTNLASFCYNSPRLLKVSVESYSNIFLDVINLSSLFEACKNLITATGFNRLTNDIVKGGVSNFFSGNYALVTTDFVFPENTGACRNTFLNCQRLENTVNSFFPTNGFISKSIDVTRVFGNCKKLQGPVNGDIFWNDLNIKWTMDPTAANGTKMTPFTGCSDEILAQVPVSWGGTMVLPENEEQPDNYYSAFEVMPNKTAITAGTADSDTGLTYRFDVAACTTHKMTLRSSQEPEDCDVIIDWGDGVVESIKDGQYVSHSKGKSYELAHDYAATMTVDTQKFIVKIYGKNYYTFRNNSYKKNNLMSRIFEADLPIASHIRNFASMVSGATRLLKVQFPHSTVPFTDVFNWTSCFTGCTNLISVTGFEDIHVREDAILNGIFQESGLVTTDFVFPTGITKMLNTFTTCTSLEMNIEDLFPAEGFGAAKIDIRSPFHATYKLQGTVPSHILWANKQTKWNILPYVTSGGTYMPFSSSDAAIKAQVPASWGGTNISIDAQLAVTDEMKADYTAWEIMCRWETVYGEFADKSYLGDLNEKTGYKYKKSLPYTASTGEGFTEKFILRTTTLQENQDIIVDWGDGTFSNVKNGDFESVSSSGFDYTMSHTYTQPTEFDKEVLDESSSTIKYRKTKRYIIKIYGKQYYGFKYTNIEPYNLMCRCLDWDLPVASHFTNLASFCYGAKGLQVVVVPEYTTYLKNAINFSSMFDGVIPNNCSNLISVTGFSKNDNDINYACNFMFNNCTNLIECDFILPNLNTGSMAGIFNNCNSLNVDINSLIPKQGFLHKEINVENLFNSTAISGNVPAKLLWKDSNITWKNTSNTFSNCSEEIRAQVPASWGGTAAEYVAPEDWIKIPTPSNMTIDDHFYELNIYFADNDQFTDAVQVTHKDCQVFNPATGLWMDCPEQGIDIALSDSLVRIQSIVDKPYIKYCWVRDGVATLPWHTL